MKNQAMFGLMAILLIGGTILPAMSQTEPEKQANINFGSNYKFCIK